LRLTSKAIAIDPAPEAVANNGDKVSQHKRCSWSAKMYVENMPGGDLHVSVA
jgi:hypothetical protein